MIRLDFVKFFVKSLRKIFRKSLKVPQNSRRSFKKKKITPENFKNVN